MRSSADRASLQHEHRRYRGEAEDVTQEVWRQLGELAEPGAVRTWLFRIAHRQCLGVLRKRKNRKTEPTDTLPETVAANLDSDPERAAPPSLLERVMRVVRTEARSGDTVPLVWGPDPARISTKAVAAVVRFAVDTLPDADLRARHCEVRSPVDAVNVLDVIIEVLAPFDHHVDEPVLRERIEAVVSAHIGLRLRELSLEVVEEAT